MQNFIEDLWENIQGYYDSIISLLPKLGLALIIFIAIVFIAGYLQRLVGRNLASRMDDPLLARFIARAVRFLLLIIGLLLFLNIVGLGAAAAGVLTGAGIGAFVIGFAFKDIGENLLAGIMLAFNRPFRVGDVVELNNTKGVVQTLNLRDTHIKTFDGKDIYIPNATIVKNNVVNYTIDGYLRESFELGLDYGSNVDKAQKLALEVLHSVPGVLKEEGKKPFVWLTSLGSSTMNLTIFYWIDTFNKTHSGGVIKTRVMEGLLNIMDEAGFYLPGDIIELKNYKDTHLKSQNPNKNGVSAN